MPFSIRRPEAGRDREKTRWQRRKPTGLWRGRWARWIGALALAATVTGQTFASDGIEQLLGTWSVTSQPVFYEGTLTGCTLVYDAFARDWAYSGGGYIRVTGHVGIMAVGGALGAGLKVVVNRIDPYVSADMTPSPPSRAYIVAKDLSTNLASAISSSASDTPGALYTIFQASPTFEMVAEALDAGRLTIAFNQNGGSSDIQLQIDLDVIGIDSDGQPKRSDASIESFSSCSLRLLEQLR